jgi:FixJ family two-component response regulator
VASQIIIAIIDDDPFVRESVRRLVNSMSYVAETFASADAFLTSDLAHNVRCIISDVQMHGSNARHFQRRLAAFGLQIPVIFMTALSSPVLKAQLMDAGAICVLDKPFHQQQMTCCIAEALTRTSPMVSAKRDCI